MGAVVKAAKAALEGKTVDGKALSDLVRDAFRNLANELFRLFPGSPYSDFTMPLPETIAVRFTEEDAGYVTVRPVVRAGISSGRTAWIWF